jgi:hypothetical protein
MADEYSEYILRVRVSADARDTAEDILKRYATTFKNVGLTRVDRERHGDFDKHVRRKRII